MVPSVGADNPMDLPRLDNSPSNELASAETAMKASEARLSGAVLLEKKRQADVARSALALMAWMASQKVRDTLDHWDVPRVLPVAILPFPIAFLGFIIVAELTGLIALAAAVAMVLFAAVLGGTAFLCMFPDDKSVAWGQSRATIARHAAKEHLSLALKQVQQLQREVAGAKERLTQAKEADRIRLEQERQARQAEEARCRAIEDEMARVEQERQARQAEEAQRQSLEGKCEALFSRRWREMRGDDFEQYLAVVLRTLGYEVHEVGKSGDQGVDLIVAKDGKRVAVQAKGYSANVGNFAVQEAYAGMAHYGCHACAVVTNSQFTPSAITLAESTRCLLIHEENFHDFVFGRVDLIDSADAMPNG